MFSPKWNIRGIHRNRSPIFFSNYLVFLSYKLGKKALNRNMGEHKKNASAFFVIVVPKSLVSSRVNICVKNFAHNMCLRGLNFASGLFLPANHSSEHVLHLVASSAVYNAMKTPLMPDNLLLKLLRRKSKI